MRTAALLLGGLIALAPEAQAQVVRDQGAGSYCQACLPLYKGEVYAPRNGSGANDPMKAEAQQLSLFSPWMTEYLLKAPADQYVTVNTPTVQNAGITPVVLVSTQPFTSPGSVTAALEATVDHYASLNRQQTGFYFAYYVKEDTNKNGVFCETGEPCGYLAQHTAGAFFGISGSWYYAPDLGSTTVINQLWPINLGFSFLTTPGTTCMVEFHVWPGHFFFNQSRPLRWGNVRFRVTRGPNDGS